MAKVFYTILAAIIAVVAADRCHPETCNGKQHTACVYRSPAPASTCNKVQTTGVKDYEKKEIVDAHNKFRAKVASGKESLGHPGPQPAGIIPPLKWDDELAKTAQIWANQCQMGHDKCRDVDRFQVGQNIATKMHSAKHVATMSELVQLWYDEVKDFDSRQVSAFKWQSTPQIGHYTQLVWGDTTTVGCGLIRYLSRDNWFTTRLVCNYGPAGNWIGSKLYQTSAWPAATCGTVQSSSLTSGEINDILRTHNDKRAFVARGAERRGIAGPQPAGRIPPLTWDNELAQIAQRWANQCQFGHDTCRNVDRFRVGQNIAKMMYSNNYHVRLSDLVEHWYNEVKDFNRNYVRRFRWQSSPKIGHYTQLVWGNTRTVGCGAIRYKDWYWYTTYLVCNYGPTGNYIGQRVY
ncbi:GSCOCG00008318001-RA-CDS [Cotesia congregata]|nr:GSCOCG00008318001-RA-CDS [Cotesia congregata]